MPGTFPRAAITAMSEWMDVRVSRAGAEIGAVTVSVGPTRVGLGVAATAEWRWRLASGRSPSAHIFAYPSSSLSTSSHPMPLTAPQKTAIDEVVRAITSAYSRRAKRRLADMFLELVDKEYWPEYYQVPPIRNPI